MSKADKLRIPDYLGHILEAARRINLYVANMTRAQFLQDAKTQDAVIRKFEIIGEACRNIDSHHPDFTLEHPEVPWGFAYEMRNALAHGYFKVDLEIVWTTIHHDLPGLATQIGELLGKSTEA
jgi:uncharacterized protein with HEPN domain